MRSATNKKPRLPLMASTRSVLLVMDFQHGVVERMGNDAVVDAVNRAVVAARGAGVPVMFVRVAFRPDFPEVAETNVAFSGAASSQVEYMHEDHAATQIHAALKPAEGETIIVK